MSKQTFGNFVWTDFGFDVQVIFSWVYRNLTEVSLWSFMGFLSPALSKKQLSLK